MDPFTALAALAPLVVDLGKSLIGRFINTDGYKPASVAEWLQMRASDLDMFKAMNEAGAGSAVSYPWVEAIVKLQRPMVGAIVLATWAGQEMYAPGGASVATSNFAAAVGFYLFGDRTLFHIKAAAKK